MGSVEGAAEGRMDKTDAPSPKPTKRQFLTKFLPSSRYRSLGIHCMTISSTEVVSGLVFAGYGYGYASMYIFIVHTYTSIPNSKLKTVLGQTKLSFACWSK